MNAVIAFFMYSYRESSKYRFTGPKETESCAQSLIRCQPATSPVSCSLSFVGDTRRRIQNSRSTHPIRLIRPISDPSVGKSCQPCVCDFLTFPARRRRTRAHSSLGQQHRSFMCCATATRRPHSRHATYQRIIQSIHPHPRARPSKEHGKGIGS